MSWMNWLICPWSVQGVKADESSTQANYRVSLAQFDSHPSKMSPKAKTHFGDPDWLLVLVVVVVDIGFNASHVIFVDVNIGYIFLHLNLDPLA